MFENELKILNRLYLDGTFSQPFYNKRIPDVKCFSNYHDFQSIPFMTKEDIRNTSAFERSSVSPGGIYGVFSSSGTTGEKTYYVYSKTDKKVHEEFVRTFYSELGISSDDLGGVFAPVDTGVMAHTMMWQFSTMGAGYINCPEPSPENMIKTVEAVPVSVIATRPNIVSSILSDPKLIERARKSSVRTILSGGGFLSEERRKLNERLWDAQNYNMFGMSEVFGPMAGECRKKDGQHYLNQYLMIELLHPDTLEPVENGEIGMAVYTTLWNKGFPLLRYWTDDLMTIEDTPCACGSHFPRIRYRGRKADCFYIDGRYVFPEELENCLMRYGFYNDYQARECIDGSIVVTIEKREEQTVSSQMNNEIRKLLIHVRDIQYVPPSTLNYPGHGPRFQKIVIS